jgi:2-hydroxy-6-oxonona-2,4-dienedioate hydrolase
MARLTSERDDVAFYPGTLGVAPIVMLPGLIAGSWMWEATLRRLNAAGYPCVTIRDPIAVAHSTVDAASAHLTAQLDRLEVDKVTIFGASLGSIVALTFQSRNPGRVDSMLLSGAPTMGRRADLGVSGHGKPTHAVALEVANRLFYDRSCLSDEIIDATLRLFLDRNRLLNVVRLLRECNAYDIATALRNLKSDVLMVWGENDRISYCDDWERLAPLARHGTFVKISRCGHTPMIERPDEFNAVVLDYLQSRLDLHMIADGS